MPLLGLAFAYHRGAQGRTRTRRCRPNSVPRASARQWSLGALAALPYDRRQDENQEDRNCQLRDNGDHIFRHIPRRQFADAPHRTVPPSGRLPPCHISTRWRTRRRCWPRRARTLLRPSRWTPGLIGCSGRSRLLSECEVIAFQRLARLHGSPLRLGQSAFATSIPVARFKGTSARDSPFFD